MSNTPGPWEAETHDKCKCKECNRLKACIYAVVSVLVNNRASDALNLARVGMYGGNVNNPLDCQNPKRHHKQATTLNERLGR